VETARLEPTSRLLLWRVRKKTKIKDGGSQYLFFTTLKNENLKVLICSQVF